MSSSLQILIVVGTVALFLYGMKTLSESMQRIAGGSLRRLLSTLTASSLRGLGTGTLTTSIMQSSSAMTVMIVSFVHAGLLSLRQAIPLVMGANIGTTVTAWLVALFGFSFDISTVALPLVGIGFPILLSRRAKPRAWGRAIIGFGLILLSINILKIDMKELALGQETMQLFAHLKGLGAWAPLCYVGIGALTTLVVQSSSATIALTIILSGGGYIPFESALALILGENLGTTSTANIAALFTNRTGKQVALFHTLFNLFGIMWALPLLPLLSGALSEMTIALGGGSPLLSTASQPIAIALFHSLFNITNTLLLFFFIPYFTPLMERLLPVHSKEKNGILHLNNPFLTSSELSFYQAQNELFEIVRRFNHLFDQVAAYFLETNLTQAETLHQRITMDEIALRQKEFNLVDFLDRESLDDVSMEGVKFADHLLRSLARMTRSSAYMEELTQVIHYKRTHGIWFSPLMRAQVSHQIKVIEQSTGLLERILREGSRGLEARPNVDNLRQQMAELRATITQIHSQAESQATDARSIEQAALFLSITTMFDSLGARILDMIKGHTEHRR